MWARLMQAAQSAEVDRNACGADCSFGRVIGDALSMYVCQLGLQRIQSEGDM